MCTQELIWCSCGHGEFLPIVKCVSADILGTCWTVVYGDRDVVLDMKCSYCTMGFNDRVALSANTRPDANRDQKMMEKWQEEADEQEKQIMGRGTEQTEMKMEVPTDENKEDVAMGEASGEMADTGLDDVLDTDWDQFFADKDLWQYA